MAACHHAEELNLKELKADAAPTVEPAAAADSDLTDVDLDLQEADVEGIEAQRSAMDQVEGEEGSL